MPAKRISYPALLVVQNARRFYFATIPVDALFPSCFVARRDEDPLAGFQRALNEARADDIAKYLADGNGSIPSNIVLSAQDNADFRYDGKTKSISFTPAPSAFLVLDGQHRLWGYQKCRERHRVPVAIYKGLSRADEAKLFIDINTTQRGVPAALLLDIKQLAHMEDAKESTLRALFDKLNESPNSPLAGKLSAAQSVTGKISRVTFNRAVGKVLSTGVLRDTDPENRYRLLRNYFAAFDAELKDKALLTRSAFFEAICEVFDTAVQRAVAIRKNAKQESIQEVISPLTKLSYRGSGARALLDKTSIVSGMQSALSLNVGISPEML
jgi:DGQHR domain-containing protein